MERLQHSGQIGIRALVLPGPRMNDGTTTDGSLSRFVAQDEAISSKDRQRFGRHDLTVRGFLRPDRVARSKQDDLCQSFGGSGMHPDALMILNSLRGRWPHFHPGVEAFRGQRNLSWQIV